MNRSDCGFQIELQQVVLVALGIPIGRYDMTELLGGLKQLVLPLFSAVNSRPGCFKLLQATRLSEYQPVLVRPVDEFGNTIDFYLSSTRNTKAVKRFLGKALKTAYATIKGFEVMRALRKGQAGMCSPSAMASSARRGSSSVPSVSDRAL